ncbi:MAG: hypothetical protein K6T28_05855 [Acidothermus sp.]|nr:hypothetical protein [Acidothermus sp.]
MPDADGPSLDGPRRAAAYLRRLLNEPGPYRRRWQQHALRLRGNSINQAAVAQVLARRLWEAGERDEEHADLPRELKDRVARALRGEVLSPATLRLFIEAFDFTEAEAGRLWQLLSGRGVAGREALEVRTTLWHESLVLGADGSRREHRVIQVIQAQVPEVRRHEWLVEGAADAVEVVHGGRLAELTTVAPQHCLAVIEFDHPLARGETHLLECVATFPPGGERPVELRRSTEARLENVELLVRFHPHCLPRQLWWVVGEADGLERTKSAALEAGHTVRRRISSIEHGFVALRWQW